MKKYLLILVMLLKEILTVKADNNKGCQKADDIVTFEDLLDLEPEMRNHINLEQEYYDNVGIEEYYTTPEEILKENNFGFNLISINNFETSIKEIGDDYLFCIIYEKHPGKDQRIKIFFNLPNENYAKNNECINDVNLLKIFR